MRIERTKNAARNIIFGSALKIYQILLPFIMRTIMIYFMGVEYLGLNSLFTSVLQVLNLAELGVGSAMVYSMYKPIAEDDTYRICALMRLYRTYYNVIGGVIAIVGLAITPFIPHLIKGDLPSDVNVFILYLMNLALTVLSYWLFAYKNSLFLAHQRTDVPSKILLATTTVQYVLQIIALIILKNYYVYILVAMASQVMTNIVTAVAATKLYPDYNPKGELTKSEVNNINQRIRDLFTSKIGTVIVNSADTIVISAFLGLTVLAVYQNYYYILTSIIGIVSIVFASCTAGIGNSVIVESKEKNYNDLKKFTFLISWIAGFCACCFLCLFQPAMEIWVGKDLMLEFSAVVCFVIYYFIYEINQLLNTYKDAAGMWHEDRFRPLVTAVANLSLNLIIVRFIGIYGIILSTVLSMLFVGMPWLVHNLFTVLFDKSQMRDYLKHLGTYVIVVGISCLLCGAVCSFVEFAPWVTLMVRLMLCCLIPNVFYLILYRKTPEFQQCMQLLDRMTKYKFNLEKMFLK